MAIVRLLEKIDSKRECSYSIGRMKLLTISLFAALGLSLSSGLSMANLFDVKKAVEGTICKKLATDYAKDASTFNVQSIAKLQICLAQTLKAKSSPVAPRNFDIQPPAPALNRVDSTLPTLPRLPTSPTPPSSIKIR